MNELVKRFIESRIDLGPVTLPFSPLELTVGFVLPLLLGFLLYRLVLRLMRRLLEKSRLSSEGSQRLYGWFRIVLRVLYLLLLVSLFARLFGAKLGEYWLIFYGILNQPIIKSGGTSVSFVTLLLTVPIFYLANWAGRGAKGLMNPSFLRRMGMDEAKQFSVSNLLRYTVMVVVLLIGLSIIGIDLSALTVIFGVLGIGLGFGLQNLVANLFAGLIIIITRPIKEGDFVFVEGLEGTVFQIRIISTVINTVRNETIIVPNSDLVSRTVYNNSYEDKSVIIENRVGVSYSSDIPGVQALLEEITSSCPFRRQGKPSFVRLEEFGASGINFLLLTWIADVHEKFAAHHWINMEIWKRFKLEGIEIPFSQLDLHVHSKNLSGENDR